MITKEIFSELENRHVEIIQSEEQSQKKIGGAEEQNLWHL